LLALFAGQAAIALAVIRRNRATFQLLVRERGEPSELTQMARLLDELGDDQRSAGVDLLDTLHRLLSRTT
jgi:hypothetical protein